MPKFLVERIHKNHINNDGGKTEPTLPGKIDASNYRAVDIDIKDITNTKTLTLLSTVDAKFIAKQDISKVGEFNGK